MPLYQYVKRPISRRRRRPALLSFFLMSLGAAILVWVLWPIISFTIFTSPLFVRIITPLPDGQLATRPPEVVSPLVLAVGINQEQTVSLDYTNPNIWFPAKPQKRVVTPVNTYQLSIPKLNIFEATVVIAGDDLNKSLIHYGGTGLPGEYGTAVIFGHSVLPQFFNPQNYKTIFSTLPKLAVGDEIFITYDGIKYRYVIYEMMVTEPNDLSPLEQRFDDSYLTLITCVPPGTYWKRLNVKARLARLPS